LGFGEGQDHNGIFHQAVISICPREKFHYCERIEQKSDISHLKPAWPSGTFHSNQARF